MATIRKVDLSEQCFNDRAFTKPPLPSRPTSGKFQIRGSGKIFKTTYHNEQFSQHETSADSSAKSGSNNSSKIADNSLAIVLHPEANKEDTSPSIKRDKPEPSYRRQTKSAKARTNHNTTNNNTKTKPTRPFSAGSAINRTQKSCLNVHAEKVPVIDLSDKVIPDLFEIEKERLLALPEAKHDHDFYRDPPPMHFNRPFSAHVEHESSDKCFCKREALPKKVAKGLKPSVYGLQNNRHVYGSAPDLRMKDSDSEKCPYKLTTTESAFEKSPADNLSERETPHTLEPLMPWLNKDVSKDLIGVDPSNCLVFLPPCQDWTEIPEVPDVPQSIEADLPYMEDITTPKPWKPKKYPHPFYENKLSVDEWVCDHRPPAPEPGEEDWHTIYRKTVKLPRMRTADIVRKEINDLENLMKGVGTTDSDCGMAKYQSEIQDFQEALRITMDMIPDRLKNPPESVDRFGMKKVFKDHDEFMERVCEKMSACREELAELELEAGIATDRQYFRKRSNSVL